MTRRPTVPLLSSLSAGMSRQRKNDRGLPGATRNNPNPVKNTGPSGPRNSGFERYMDLERHARGGRRISGRDNKSGAVYTEGPYSGMTQGQADAKQRPDLRKKWNSMTPEEQDQYRDVTAADMESNRQAAIQAERDKAMVARESEMQRRKDEARFTRRQERREERRAENQANQDYMDDRLYGDGKNKTFTPPAAPVKNPPTNRRPDNTEEDQKKIDAIVNSKTPVSNTGPSKKKDEEEKG